MPRGLNRQQQIEVARAGAKAAPSKGGLSVPAFDPSKFAGAAADTGIRKLTPQDIRTMQANQAAQMGAGLAGPFTPEAVASGYNSTVASLYGVNFPKAQQFVSLAQRNRWDQATFERWLRSRPDFASTSVGSKMRADAVTVMAQVFGVIG